MISAEIRIDKMECVAARPGFVRSLDASETVGVTA